jgi:hypothetical protein
MYVARSDFYVHAMQFVLLFCEREQIQVNHLHDLLITGTAHKIS